MFQVSSDELGKNSWNDIKAWLIHADAKVDSQETGIAIPKHKKSFPYPINLFSFEIEKDEEVSLVIKLEGLSQTRSPGVPQLYHIPKDYYRDVNGVYVFSGDFSVKKETTPVLTNWLFHQEMYEDPDHRSISFIQSNWEQLERKDLFELSPKPNIPYWLKLRILGSPYFKGNTIFQLGEYNESDNYNKFGFDSIQAFIYTDNTIRALSSTGGLIRPIDRPWKHWAQYVQLDLPEKDTVDVFIRVKGSQYNLLPKHIQLFHVDESSMWDWQVNEGLLHGLFYGILIIQFCYFFLLYWIERELLHLYLSFFVLGLLLIFGFGASARFIILPFWRNFHLLLFRSGFFVSILGLLMFTRSYFQFKEERSFFKYLIPIYLLIHGLVCYINSFDWGFLPRNTILLSSLLGLVLIVRIVIRSKKVLPKFRNYYLLAFSPLFVLMATYAFLVLLKTYGMIDARFSVGFDLYNGMKIATVMMLVLLALGAGSRTNQLKQEIAKSKHIMELAAFKQKFYSNITHEFRTPLTIILGMADQIKINTNDWLEEGTNMIKRNGNDLLRLVNQMLELNKLESGHVFTQLIQSDIIDYITYLLESFHSYADTQQVQVDIQTEISSLYMDYDPQKIQQIISNLVSNAIKFTPEKGQVKIKLATIKDNLLISIEDSGIGIPAAQIPYIFDRFYQAQEDSNEPKGTGIGLALTKELVKLLKGDIQVSSEENIGSIFTISLPISREAQLIEPTAYEDQKHGMQSHHIEKKLVAEGSDETDLPLILLVEDNADVIRYIDSLLASKYRLVFAQNGQEGIDKAMSIIPDLIISDVMMPEKDGFELCQSLKSSPHTSHIPIILLTARTEIEAKLAGLEYGADAYLAKPFNKSELLVRIRKLLEVREQLKHYYLSLINPQHDIPANLAPASKVENAFVIQAREIVMAHLADERFAVKDFCLEIGMSHSQLHRKLVALTGYSSNRFIRFIRLTHAKQLIKAEGYSISEAAFATSYKDPSYFARVFRKEFGISPSEFKERS